MKKALFLLTFLPAFLALFTACSSKDDENDYSLDGTTWVNEEEGVRELMFTKKAFIFTHVQGDETDNDAGTYTYKPPFITFRAVNRETQKIETGDGVISGNKLTWGEIVYTKK